MACASARQRVNLDPMEREFFVILFCCHFFVVGRNLILSFRSRCNDGRATTHSDECVDNTCTSCADRKQCADTNDISLTLPDGQLVSVLLKLLFDKLTLFNNIIIIFFKFL